MAICLFLSMIGMRERLIRAFQESGFRTQAEAARAIGVHPVTFSEWLSGRRRPREKYWPRIEQTFGRPRAWYYSEQPVGNRGPTTAMLRRIHEELVRLARLTGDMLEAQAQPVGPRHQGQAAEEPGKQLAGKPS